MEQEHAETYAQFKSIREDSQQLWKIKFYVDSARKNLEQSQQHTSHKQDQEILIPSFCQKGDQSIFSMGSICNRLRMLPIFSFFCVVKHHRWYYDARTGGIL